RKVPANLVLFPAGDRTAVVLGGVDRDRQDRGERAERARGEILRGAGQERAVRGGVAGGGVLVAGNRGNLPEPRRRRALRRGGRPRRPRRGPGRGGGARGGGPLLRP